MQEKMKPMEYNQSKRVNWIYCMQVHDKTLALAEEGYQEEDYGIPRVCIWNPETMQFIHRLNENSFKMAMGLTQEEFHTHKIRVCKIALAEDKLAVFLWVVGIGGSLSYQTQIWKLDTAGPSTANIQFWKTIEHHDIHYGFSNRFPVCAMVMNSKLLCLAIKNKHRTS